MKNVILLLMLLWGLISTGCGGSGSGSSSSFDVSSNAPEIENITAFAERNISSVVTEENGEYKIYVNENQRTAFKIKANDRSNITYAVSGRDWQEFDVDAEGGNFAFKEFTDYERKSIYKFIVIAKDVVGNKTEKKATIYVKDSKSEKELPKVINDSSSLPTDNESKYFITTWKTDNNATHPKQITIPTFGDGYLYSVDWGDGTSSKDVIRDITHTYSEAGTYRVKISGKFPRIYFAKGAYDNLAISLDENNFKIISIDQWGEIEWSSMAKAFAGCLNLQGQALDKPNLLSVKEMRSMFYKAELFNQNIGDWDVSYITNMRTMFYQAKSFNQDIGDWDVSHVTNMKAMFYKAQSFNQNIGDWDVSAVTNMKSMFESTSFNQDISSWNVANVSDMGNMFYKNQLFNQNIGNWNVINVTNMYGMFAETKAFNQDIENWNVTNVTNMYGMFYKAQSFNQDIESWNVSSDTNMTYMFYQASSLEKIPSWYHE